ncbi:hypothetical protein DOY81_002586 [Sarcophaga bullata]|nr:hypothetical protein DOY81_002586 [Sarcophaga bullata]
MRYLYGQADEKYIKNQLTTNAKEIPLSSFKFSLNPVVKGKTSAKEFDRQDIPIVFKCSPDKLVNLCASVIDAWPLPEVYKWTIEDICRWLRGLGFKQYQNTFRENLINGRTFLLLDASALSAMNIKDFEHIKRLTYGIRSLFYFEMTKFGRSLTLYPEFLPELYKLFRVKTGYIYESVRRSDLWRKMQLIRQKEPNYTHWEILERWLAFEKEPPVKELIGGAPRSKLYRCRSIPTEPAPIAKPPYCCACVPPCQCYWRDDDCRPPWRFDCLPHLLPDNEFCEHCIYCLPPCTCRWSSKKYLTRGILKCLRTSFPQKYGGINMIKRYERISAAGYRLSLYWTR